MDQVKDEVENLRNEEQMGRNGSGIAIDATAIGERYIEHLVAEGKLLRLHKLCSRNIVFQRSLRRPQSYVLRCAHRTSNAGKIGYLSLRKSDSSRFVHFLPPFPCKIKYGSGS